MSLPSNYLAAIEEWSRVLDPRRVTTDSAFLGTVRRATFGVDHDVPAAIFPASTAEVRDCLLVASKFRVPVYPVSGGKNWGYGSRAPTRGRCVLMDLARMSAILDYDASLGFVAVQPGVSFADVATFLKARDSTFFCPTPATTPQASVIGNVLERGIGLGPHAERAAHVCDFEVVLPNGQVIRTGLGHFTGSLAAGCWRWSLGPQLDGLFSQSGLGVVTQMTIWLSKKPTHFRTFEFGFSDGDLPTVVDAIRELRMAGVLRTNVTIGNNVRLLTARTQFPLDVTDRSRRRERLESLSRDHSLSPWSAEGALYSASWLHAHAERRLLARALGSRAVNLRFLSDRRARLVQTLRLWHGKGAVQRAHRHLTSRFLGGTAGRSLRALYWRKPNAVSEEIDPDNDRCGLIWYSAVTPLSGSRVEQAVHRIRDTMVAFGFDPSVGISTVSDRAAYITAAILYDLDDSEEDGKAKQCYKTLVQVGAQIGVYPARLVLGDMDLLPVPSDDHERYLSAVRSLSDPADILSPGRYSRGNS